MDHEEHTTWLPLALESQVSTDRIKQMNSEVYKVDR